MNQEPSHSDNMGLPEADAAAALDVTIEDVRVLKQQGISLSRPSDIEKIKTSRGPRPSVAQAATQVGIQLQRDIAASVTRLKRLALFVGALLLGYALLTVTFVGLFIISPIATAKWLGYTATPSEQTDGSGSTVLGVNTSPMNESNALYQVVLQPISRLSLDILKVLNPGAYSEVAKVTILDPNAVLGLSDTGTITPIVPITLPASSFLKISDTQLIDNLNAQYLNGRQPGTNPGDIAIVPEAPAADLLSDPLDDSLGLDAAGFTVGDFASPNISQWTNNAGYITASSTNSLTNKTITALTNTISGLTAANLNPGNFASVITSGNYSINVTGTSTGFTGLLAGDVTGTQAANTVARINGTTLGATTATAGNILVGNGTAWVTTALSGDATLAGTGVLTLKNTGTAATYGTAIQIPVFTTDAQGRVTAVTNTTIAGLNPLNFLTANISQWTNDTGFITASTTDTLTNKTITAGSNTITGLSATNLTSGNYSSVITSGTYLIDVTGSATSFTGLLAGDVTGTQGLNVVARINGATLGLTTPTAGNILIGSGAAWVTNSLSGDATISATGLLTLKNTGTANTYGTASQIPIFTTDAQGRVTGVTNTTIAGLSPTNFTTANISQWTNDTGFITASSSDTLTNKTIAAGSNTITGLTNTNLSGSAGITNANLANSAISLSGNSGSGSVALGGTLTLTGAGITGIVASGSGFTITGTEADTLQSTYARGNTIATTTTTGDGIYLNSTAASLGVGDVLSGLRIAGPTTIPASGTYRNLQLDTSTSSTANTYDAATIAVGNILSTANQNFTTLNLVNGGSGFLDVELIRGFINFRDMNQFYDDFMDRTVNTTNRWTATTTGAGSTCQIFATGLGGLLRMVSGPAASRACEMSTQVIASLTNGYYQRGNNPTFETKLKINVVTNARIFAGFTDTRIAAGSDANASTHHAYIGKRSTDTEFQCITDDGGATETFTSTGVTVVINTNYRLRVEVRNGTTPQTICTVDDGTTITRTIVTATQPGVADPMDLYLKVGGTDAVAKTMDVDYVRVWQDDPPESSDPAPQVDVPASNEAAVVADIEASTNSEPEQPQVLAATDTSTNDQNHIALSSLFAQFIQQLLQNTVEFLAQVTFAADVEFKGRPTFNGDTAGLATILQGEDGVHITFARSYASTPIITTSINLTSAIPASEIPAYAVYDASGAGFTIKLAQPTATDLTFSWIALQVGNTEVPLVESIVPAAADPDMISPQDPIL